MTLYFFGDSHTYGTCLRDCIDNGRYAGQMHSQLSFPTLTSVIMNLPYKNMGISGASNQQIFHTIRNSGITKHDRAIICWSHWSRNFACTADGGKQILPHFKHCEGFYSLFDDAALHYNNLLTLEHANLWLRNKSIPVLNLSIHNQDNDLANYFMLDFMDRHAVDSALDNLHFGEQSHSIWAKIVAEYITAQIFLDRKVSLDTISEEDVQWLRSNYSGVYNIELVILRAKLILSSRLPYIDDPM